MDIAEIVFQNENRHRLIEYDLYESCLKRQLFYFIGKTAYGALLN